MEEKEPTTDSLLARFVKQTAYTSTGTGLTLVFGMVNTMILARYLPRWEFGIFILFEVLLEFLSMISYFGLDISITQSIASASEEDKAKIANSVIVFRFFSLCLASVVFLLGQNWFFLLFGGADVSGLAIFVPFMLLVQGYRRLLRLILQGYFRFEQMALIDLVTSALNLVMIIVFIILMRASLVGQIYARVLSWAIGCLLLYLAVPGPKSARISPRHLFQVMRFGLPLQLNDVLAFIFRSLGTLLVGTLLGPADVALLGVAGKIPSMVRRLYDAFHSVYLPNLSKLLADGDERRALRLLNTSLRLISFTTALGALIAALFADDIVRLLFSEQYLPGSTVLILAMAGLNISLVGNILGISLVSAGDSKGATIANAIAAFANLPLNITLIPLLGVNGAPLATAAGAMVGTIGNIWFLRRRGLFPALMEFLKPPLIFAAFCLPILCFRSIPWLYRGIVLLLFLAICYLVSVLRQDDLSQALSVARYYRTRIVRQKTTTP